MSRRKPSISTDALSVISQVKNNPVGQMFLEEEDHDPTLPLPPPPAPTEEVANRLSKKLSKHKSQPPIDTPRPISPDEFPMTLQLPSLAQQVKDERSRKNTVLASSPPKNPTCPPSTSKQMTGSEREMISLSNLVDGLPEKFSHVCPSNLCLCTPGHQVTSEDVYSSRFNKYNKLLSLVESARNTNILSGKSGSSKCYLDSNQVQFIAFMDGLSEVNAATMVKFINKFMVLYLGDANDISEFLQGEHVMMKLEVYKEVIKRIMRLQIGEDLMQVSRDLLYFLKGASVATLVERESTGKNLEQMFMSSISKLNDATNLITSQSKSINKHLSGLQTTGDNINKATTALTKISEIAETAKRCKACTSGAGAPIPDIQVLDPVKATRPQVVYKTNLESYNPCDDSLESTLIIFYNDKPSAYNIISVGSKITKVTHIKGEVLPFLEEMLLGQHPRNIHDFPKSFVTLTNNRGDFPFRLLKRS